MAYNNKNRIELVRNVQRLVQEHFIADVTTYKGVFDKYVYPVYPMSYGTFLKMINTVVPKQRDTTKDGQKNAID